MFDHTHIKLVIQDSRYCCGIDYITRLQVKSVDTMHDRVRTVSAALAYHLAPQLRSGKMLLGATDAKSSINRPPEDGWFDVVLQGQVTMPDLIERVINAALFYQ